MHDSGYGQVVWLYNIDGEGIYLLAHLNAYDSQIAVGKEYFPGETVAYMGGSGRDKNLEAWSPHLHLSYYKYEVSLTDIDIDGDTISIVNIKNLKDYFRNPFNHESESWKGTKWKKNTL